MFSRAELEYKFRVCEAQAGLRVVAFTAVLVIPVWIGAWVAQKLGYAHAVGMAARPAGVLLLLVYAAGVWRILRRTHRDHGLACPSCGRSIGFRAKQILASGSCPFCEQKILR